jgi:hypothetical protein
MSGSPKSSDSPRPIAKVLEEFTSYDNSLGGSAPVGRAPIEDELDSVWPRIEEATEAELTAIRRSVRRSGNLRTTCALLRYSFRMATRSVRDKNSDYIVFALMAASHDERYADSRDLLRICSLCHDAADYLGVPAQPLFYRASNIAPPEFAQLLRDYVDIPEYVKTLEEMGYQRVNTPDGPAYVRES